MSCCEVVYFKDGMKQYTEDKETRDQGCCFSREITTTLHESMADASSSQITYWHPHKGN